LTCLLDRGLFTFDWVSFFEKYLKEGDKKLDPNGTYGVEEIIARNKMANFYTQNGVRRRISEYKALQLCELLNHKIKLDR